MKRKKNNLIFRFWFYFRQGWGIYFAFLVAVINTLTVTYFLAIEKIPTLLSIFPTFLHYVFIISLIGIPLLLFVGFLHFKRSAAFKEESAVNMESNPYYVRILVNTEILVQYNIELIRVLQRLSNDKRLTEEETKEITELSKSIEQLTKNRTITNKKDLEFFAERIDEKN